MNVVVASLVEPLQVPYNYYSCKKSQIKTNPKCVMVASSSSGVGSLVIETNQDQQQISTSTETPTTTLSSVAARRLILLRHAKSSWENRSIRDHDRPLSRSGQLDAIKVSQNLLKLGWIPQLILSSDALRTRETLKIMQEQVQAFLEAEVHFISSFYSVAAMDGQTTEHLRQAICKYSRDEILTVMCMGHNRGWEEAASVLSGVTVELKTCNAALLEATGKSWEEVYLVPHLYSPWYLTYGPVHWEVDIWI
ncbi:hypothetical protein KY290_020879 [Solanum tuberosum]|uniref:Phosphoglycerate mutase n=1 Tax=Solanum tuberosum TaxID=4113 RepID=A0ABQ7V1Y8_SOLTU|nr:hypothetical protein KY290_020879 [Solanum tuberosum]